jgi:hypothetical protein
VYEYYLKIWGGAMETIQKELGVKEKDHWFHTKEERDAFINKLKPYNHLGLAYSKEEGEDVRKRTIVKLHVKYKGEEYTFEYDFGYAYSIDNAKFMFEDGNYSCDCNLSIFIKEKYPDFPELDCGNEVEYISIEVVQK